MSVKRSRRMRGEGGAHAASFVAPDRRHAAHRRTHRVRLPRLTKKLAIVAAAVGLSFAAAGAAFAYYSGSGSGTGHATVGSAVGWTITPNGTTFTLLPGSTPQGVYVKVTNVTTGDEEILARSVKGAIPSTGGDVVRTTAGTAIPIPGCLVSWFHVTSVLFPTPNHGPGSGYGKPIDAGASVTLVVNVSMKTTGPQNECEGTHPLVTLTITGGPG